ncbi:hypothetical protein AB0H43_10365 [Hamadaea sp. NPDC050747]|uniref:hypothetical protein n=1 Tax=Hamadaea sp. NPDC050747 TaxID=3155789 RepID=UPI0033D59B1D
MVPNAAALWFLLVLFAVYATGWLIVPGVRRWTRDAARLRTATVLRRERLSTLAVESTRYAGEVTVAADRAGARETRLRELWHQAQAELERAEQAYDAADERWRRLTLAAAVASDTENDEDLSARVRHLRRIVTEAALRGQISPLALGDAVAGRDGWDPERPLADQERQLSRVVRQAGEAAYRAVAQRERNAWDAYVAAADQARSLRREANAATERAQHALSLLAPARVQPQPLTTAAWNTPTQVLTVARRRP